MRLAERWAQQLIATTFFVLAAYVVVCRYQPNVERSRSRRLG